MRPSILFLSRLILGLWLALVGAFLWLLLPNAPDVPANAPFASVSIRTEQNSLLYLPNPSFRCNETNEEFQCQIDIQDRLLTLNLTKGEAYPYDLSNCRASYGRQVVDCREMGYTYAPTLAKLYEITNLPLSLQQVQAIRQTYWGINTLMRWGELRLIWTSVGLSLTAGICAAFFTWLHLGVGSKAFVSFACGFGVYQLVEGFLGRVPFDWITPYGLSPDAWFWTIRGGAIAVGIIAMLATLGLLRRGADRPRRVLISSLTGTGIFSLALWSFQWNLGYAISSFHWAHHSLQNGYLWASLFFVMSTLVAIAAVILLCSYTPLSIQKFLTLGSGFGAVALTSQLLMYLLLDLGYLD